MCMKRKYWRRVVINFTFTFKGKSVLNNLCFVKMKKKNEKKYSVFVEIQYGGRGAKAVNEGRINGCLRSPSVGKPYRFKMKSSTRILMMIFASLFFFFLFIFFLFFHFWQFASFNSKRFSSLSVSFYRILDMSNFYKSQERKVEFAISDWDRDRHENAKIFPFACLFSPLPFPPLPAFNS